MFLQNFFNWKPVRAIAMFMAVLIMATACQETAQVINQPIAAKKSAVQSENADTKAIAQNAPLSEAELALVKKMEGDKDVAAMSKIQQTLMFKMKIAIGHDKEGFKQAILNKDNKRFLELMNFSESEYAEFSAKIQQHRSNFNMRYADDMKTIENLKKRYSALIKTSQDASSNSDAAALDEQLAVIEKANIGSTEKIQITPEECSVKNPPAYARYLEGQRGITLCFYLGLPIVTPLGPIAVGAWVATFFTSLIINQCETCGCPWD